MDKILTSRENDVLAYIKSHFNDYREAPTIEEIRAYLGINSIGSTHKYVNGVRDKGRIIFADTGARKIRLTLFNEKCPCCGK